MVKQQRELAAATKPSIKSSGVPKLGLADSVTAQPDCMDLMPHGKWLHTAVQRRVQGSLWAPASSC